MAENEHREQGNLQILASSTTCSIANAPFCCWRLRRKRKTFALPHRKKARRRMRIGSALTSDKKNVNEAIRQVQRFCSDTGARFAIATNGYCFIIFRAIVEGMAWKEGQAIVFQDFNDVFSNFTETLEPTELRSRI